MASCIHPEASKHARMLGLSLLYGDGVVHKPYFSATESLLPAERGCLARGLRGLAFVGAPTKGVYEYTVRIEGDGVAVTSRGAVQ
ncbi:MAG: hypothetical protein H6708_30300 [Kofleriaceae bacterium]|nr:hypothetical protein [Kofleriaceae bacterium]